VGFRGDAGGGEQLQGAVLVGGLLLQGKPDLAPCNSRTTKLVSPRARQFKLYSPRARNSTLFGGPPGRATSSRECLTSAVRSASVMTVL
jgi:hypothetical protein